MLIDKIKLHNPINLRSNFNKKIAVLFRGPIRPNAEAVAANTSGLIEELRFAGYNVTPYLATWSNYNRAEVMKLLSMGLYDNIIMQQLPTREHIRRCVNRDSYGIYPIVNVYGMYYQSKTAIDLIASANNYNYIVHSRTDLHVRFGKHLHEWFDNDKYVSPINETPWICDWIGIATPEIMQNGNNKKNDNRLL